MILAEAEKERSGMVCRDFLGGGARNRDRVLGEGDGLWWLAGLRCGC